MKINSVPPSAAATGPAATASRAFGDTLPVSTSYIAQVLGRSVGPHVGPSVRTRIKICGLTRTEDVDAAVAAGVDAIGLVMYSASPRYVSLQHAAKLAHRLPPFVTPVLLFVNAATPEIIAACQAIPTALLQFHGDETQRECLAAHRPFLRAARIPTEPPADKNTPGFDLIKYAQDYSVAQAILLDAHVEGYGGGGKTFNWSQLPAHINSHLVLSGGLTPANVGEGILQVRPRCLSLAVDVSSGVEVSASGGGTVKGIKSAEKIRQFVAAVRAADEQFAKRSSHVPLPAA